MIAPAVLVAEAILFTGGFVLFTRSRCWVFILGLVPVLLLAGCSQSAPLPASPSPTLAVTAASTSTPTALPSPTATATATETTSPTASPTTSATSSPSPSPTSIPSATSAVTATPTAAFTPAVSATPTVEYPQAQVLMQAFCRYGPGQAYLYSHGLYPGDPLEIHGRSGSGAWLWVQPANLDRHCWAAASVMQVQGDVQSLPVVTTNLPQSTLYGPPEEVQAVRQGDQVTVAWSPVWMTEDDYRGYLIEARVCQSGGLVGLAVHVDGTSYTFTDEQTCSGPSGGLLYTVEKHGYTAPVEIPWP